MRALEIYAGKTAATHLRKHGWRGRDFSLLLGASGGPKWLILGELDRLLSSEFLFVEREQPLLALGSSVGSWRHALMGMKDPKAAYDRFQEIYLNYEYSTKPSIVEVSKASYVMLEHVFGQHGAAEILKNRAFQSYIVTARGRGLASSQRKLPLAVGMGLGALGNAIHRQLLARAFQRVVFAGDQAPRIFLKGFETTQVSLTEATLIPALHASGSIPFILAGERDIPGSPQGHYWDGGIIDYHFKLEELDRLAGEGLVLYPHFRSDITPGWFDKFLPWRRSAPNTLDSLILLAPSKEFVTSLPLGKIPDRTDFTKLSPERRRVYWQSCIQRSSELAFEFAALVEGSDPLAGVRTLG
ncbi:MAG: patatin-like phospholipase family protein [Pseudomonadota bacterium]